ncbi:zinc finger homeobox protein 3-like [Tachypleus tridentatus]|uniref:zinc finger homeobox protein 3-like n=1 Tax=Tachypleus tridentatus TaxID=6853 RepID=UPI003FD06A78
MESHTPVEDMDTGQQSARRHQPQLSAPNSEIYLLPDEVVRTGCGSEKVTTVNRTTKERHSYQFSDTPSSNKELRMTPRDSQSDPSNQDRSGVALCQSGQLNTETRSHFDSEPTQRCEKQETKAIAHAQLSGHGDKNNGADNELSESDVETFTGKILYNPDGSAYIIEGDSEMSDEECSLDLPQQTGGIVDVQGATPTQYMVFPEIINAFHIYRNSNLLSALYGQTCNRRQQKKNVPDIPMVHSYKVFNLRDSRSSFDNKEFVKTDFGGPKLRSDNEDRHKIYQYSSVPVKPILMCFMCKLSFGYAKSFVAHAVREHAINLLDEEGYILSQVNVSAIIQGVGKDKVPLISFLKPAHSVPAQVSENDVLSLSFNDSSLHLDANKHPFNCAVVVNSVSPSTSTVESTASSSHLNPTPSVKKSFVENEKKDTVQCTATIGSIAPKLEDLESIAPELEDLANIERLAKAAVAAAEATSSGSPGKFQQVNLMPKSTEAQKEDGPMTTSVSSALERRTLSTEGPTSYGSSSSESSVSPKASMSPDLLTVCSHSLASSTNTSYTICPQHLDNRHPDCSKCDMVSGSSSSLGSHMEMIHSRNSCKTLKCPKCNWHYKYQETLEIHMKEKHSENETSCVYCITNQRHPKLSRGETYTCGYKPYRCEICNYSTVTKGNLSIHMHSDKHLNNLKDLQSGNLSTKHVLPSQNVTVATASEPTKKALPLTKPKATWRCDICNYETNVARNLRIHMTSEKHTHNAMVVQQNVKHMQQLSALHYAQVMDPMFGQFHSGVSFSPDAQLQPEAALADLYYNQALIMIANQQQQQQMVMVGPNPVGNNSTQTSSLYFPYASATDVERIDPTLSSDISQGDSALFFCCVCSCFSTNSIESLNQHFQVDRTEEGKDDTMIVIGGNYVCKLCAYKTNLKANFQLHCKTDKHYQGLQHINHIREGGPRNEWKLKYAKTSNAVQVRCNVCDCYTNSIHELQLHSSNPRHEISAKLFLYLQYSENGLETETTSYQCSLCNFSANTKVKLVQHVHSLEHLRNEHLRQMQRKLEGQESVDDFREIYTVKSCRGQEKETKDSQTAQPQTDSAESKPVGSKSTNSEGQSEESKLKQTLTDSFKNGEPPERDRVLTCPLCDYTNVSEVLIQMHVVVQHSQKQNLQCPLCQECLYELPNLEKHLMESHKVSRESVDRLLMIVDKTDVESNNSKSRDHQLEGNDSNFKNDSGNWENANNNDEKADDLECPVCLKLFNNVDDLFVHQNEKGHIELKETPGGLGYICWKKGCHQFFRVSQALQMHFKEVHVKKLQLTLSDRHVYRFRCNQCRLTFKTMEKLKSHSQYHLTRATSQCVLCGRSFQSVSSLQKHVESSHTNLTKEEIKQCEASLVNNPLLSSTGNLILDPHATETLKKESNKDRAEETEKKTSSDPPEQTNQSSANVSSNSEECNTQVGHLDDCTSKEQVAFEDYLNNQVMAENSYNDPNRKYKCHRCKVAFTKQSYFTSHNKTLIHKKGEKTSYPVDRYLDPNRPYKCEVCKESFTQKNILFVHFNSVSHLHKLKQSMKDSSTIFTTLTPHNLTKPVTSNTNSSRCQSPVTTTSESEKKLYKCNICKVAYNQSSTLDIHIRSVLHQTKASKLHELAIIGEVDLNLPLIEKPELSQSQEDHKNAETGTSGISHVSANITTSLAQPSISTDFDTFPQTSLPITGSSLNGNFSPKIPFNFPHGHHPPVTQTDFPQTSGLPNPQVSPQTHYLCKRCSLSLPTQDALFHHQHICNFIRQPASSLFSYDNVPEISGSTHASTVSSFLQSKDIVSDASLKETVTKSEKLSSQNICNRDQYDTSLELPKSKEQVTFQMLLAKCPYPRSKSLIYKHLLESCGFEIVMQFNEFNQHKTRTDTEGENITSKDTAKTKSSTISNEEVQSCHEKPKNRYLPEINKSVCNICSKEFSSIWVLKAHREEYHKEIVPFTLLEHVSQEFRLYYDKKNLALNLPQQDELTSNSDTAPTPISTPDYCISSQNITNGTVQSGLSFQQVTPIIPHSSHQGGDSSNFAANQMAAQFQFQHLLMSMGFGMNVPMGMGMPFTNNIHPSLIPMMFPPPVESMMASAFSHPFMGTGFDSTAFNAQQKILQEQQEQYLQTQQQKRARTRINDDQLKILKTYFNINNSPSEEQLKEMSVKSGLPLKVIKHWFRNTLFKERQRNKDSPYNFSNPPSTFLNLEEYEKTGKAKSILAQESNQECYKDNDAKEGVTAEESKRQVSKKGLDDRTSEPKLSSDTKQYFTDSMPATPVSSESNDKIFDATGSVCDAVLQNTSIKITESSTEASNSSERCDVQSESTNFKFLYSEDITSSLTGIASAEILDNQKPQGPSSSRCSGKRANRTRFTDYQIKILQEFFETNAYPKDDSLEYLSKLLKLSPRVVVVWFQNARQKARKVYENQGPTPSDEDTNGRFQRTPGLNYQCKKCLQVFQRYYELIKHQKGSCFKDENPLAFQNNKTSTSSYENYVNPSDFGSAQGVPVTQDNRKNHQNSTYQCDKCGLKFSRFNLWREHQLVHIMNPTIFPNYPNKSEILHLDKQQTLIPPVKRKLTDDKDAPKDTSEQPRDKRLRTTILPEQLDYLYQKYQLESNPSRKMLENIAREVCLRKRVVQVWFQNTRARERKGYFRAHQQVIHKRCPFCRALFKARSALESHLATKHADKYTKGDIQIDTLPDGETDTDGANSAGEESVSAFQEMPFSNPSVMSSGLSCLSLDVMQNTTNTKHEDSLLNYLDELRISPNYKTDVFGVNVKEKEQPKINLPEARESPLDLSVPSKISVKSQKLIDSIQTNLTDKSVEDYSSKFIVSEDTVSETLSESTDREEDISLSGSQICPITQNQVSTPPSITRKRVRTQLTIVQVKIMKSIFIDYKTPSITECEFLGHEIGLPKRVVQVWFQNARAKEKKSSIAFANTYGQDTDTSQRTNECKICKSTYSVKYTNTSVQEHIFSKNHIEELKLHIEENKKNKELLKSSNLSRDLPAPIEAKQPQRDFVTSGHVKSTQSDSMQQIEATGLQQVSNLERSLLPTEPLQSSGEIEAVTSNPESLGSSNLPSASVAANTSRTLDIALAAPLASNPSTTNTSQSADVASFSTEGTAGFFPYMFTSVPASYYSGTTVSPNMYSTGCSAVKNLFRDSSIYSTHLSLLQLPPAAILDVTQKLCQPGHGITRFSQDGKNIADLKGSIQESDVEQLNEVDIDIGFVCKKCQMVYPAELLCINHQRASCFAHGKEEDRAVLKLIQVYFECKLCRERFATVLDFKFHSHLDSHVKRVEKLQRKVAFTSHSNDVNLALQNRISGARVMQRANFNVTPMLSASCPSTLYPGLATPANTSHLSSCSMTSSGHLPTGLHPPAAPPMTSQSEVGNTLPGMSFHDTINRIPDMSNPFLLSASQTDFRRDLESSLNFALGLESMMMGNGMDISTSGH